MRLPSFLRRVRAVRGLARGRIDTPSDHRGLPHVQRGGLRLPRRGRPRAQVLDGVALPDSEIVIVDDAFHRTARRRWRTRWAREDPRVRVIHNPRNRRLGRPARRLRRRHQRPRLLHRTPTFPSTSRAAAGGAPARVPAGGHRRRLPVRPHVGGPRAGRSTRSATTTSIRTLFGLRVRDVNFAFKLFRRSVLQKFTLTSERQLHRRRAASLRARKAGCVIIQIGPRLLPCTRGTSTLGSVPVILAILREMAVAVEGAALA